MHWRRLALLTALGLLLGIAIISAVPSHPPNPGFLLLQSYAQTAPPDNAFIGTWLSSNSTSPVTQAIISYQGFDGTTHKYNIQLSTNNCDVIPCNWPTAARFPGDGGPDRLVSGTNATVCGPVNINVDDIGNNQVQVSVFTGSGSTCNYFHTVLMTKVDPNKNCLNESLNYTVPDTVATTPGSSISTNIVVTASANNHDQVSAFIFLEGQQPSSPQPSIGINDFFVNPGESKQVPIAFRATSQSMLGNYTYKVSIMAKDLVGCVVPTGTSSITLEIKPQPDFVLSSDPVSIISIIRGDGKVSSGITIKTQDNSYGPIAISLNSGWNYTGGASSSSSSSLSAPSYTQVSFDRTDAKLNPGSGLARTLLLAAPFVDNYTATNYSGNFTYSIIASGVWTDSEGSNHTITKQLNIPVTIVEQPFDFSLTANKNAIFLDKGKMETSQIAVKHLSGRNYPVKLSLVTVPLELQTALDKEIGMPDFVSELDVTALDSSFPAREIEVVGTGGGITHSVKMQLSATPFTIAVEPTSPSTIHPGNSIDVRVLVTPLRQNYNSTVSLSVSSASLPENFSSISLERSQGTPVFDTLLHINTNPRIPLGNYSITITGEDTNQFKASVSHAVIVVSGNVTAFPNVQIDIQPRLDSSLIIDGKPVSAQQLVVNPSWNAGENHFISARPEITVDNQTRYIFDGWSDGVKNPDRQLSISESSLVIVGKYRPEYFLNVRSQYGAITGIGWYPAGTLANFTLDTTGVSAVAFSGSGSNNDKLSFDGWGGASASAVGVACNSDVSGTSSPSSSTSSSVTTNGAGSGGQANDNNSFDHKLSSFFICMDKPQSLVALWNDKAPSGNLNYLIMAIGGGGVAAVAAAFSYFKFFRSSKGGPAKLSSTTSPSSQIQQNQQQQQKKSNQRNFPQLAWHVYSSKAVTPGGTAYIDIVVENTGQVDVKKIKLEITVPTGIRYSGGSPATTTTIDQLLSQESKKITFRLQHLQGEGPFEVTFSISYEFMTKVVRNSDKKIVNLAVQKAALAMVTPLLSSHLSSFSSSPYPSTGTYQENNNTDDELYSHDQIRSFLQKRGFSITEIALHDAKSNNTTTTTTTTLDGHGDGQLFSKFDSVVISLDVLADLLRSKKVEMEDYLSSGKNIFVYSTGNPLPFKAEGEKMEDYKNISNLLGFSPGSVRAVTLSQGFGLRVTNTASPVTREFYDGQVFKIASHQGTVLSGLLLKESAKVLISQIGVEKSVSDKRQVAESKGEENNNSSTLAPAAVVAAANECKDTISEIPAFVQVNHGAGSIIYVNVPVSSSNNLNVLSNLIERIALYTSKLL